MFRQNRKVARHQADRPLALLVEAQYDIVGQLHTRSRFVRAKKDLQNVRFRVIDEPHRTAVPSLAVVSVWCRLSALMGSPFRPDILGPASRDEVIGRILPTFIQAHLENHDDHQVIVLG